MSGTEETEEAAGDAAVPVLTTGAGGLPAPTTGGGGSPVLTTPGEITGAGAGATRPEGGNTLPADIDPNQPNQHQQSQHGSLSMPANQTKFHYCSVYIIQHFVIFYLQMID